VATRSQGLATDEPYNPDYDQLAFFMNTTMQAWRSSQDAAAAVNAEQEPQFAMVLAGDKHCYSRYDNQAQAEESQAELRAATELLADAQRAVSNDPMSDTSAEAPTPALDEVAQRHADATQRLTRRVPHVLCGGGGAYLSLPFHHAKKVTVPKGWRRQQTLDLDLAQQWPEVGDTNRLAITALWRIVMRNWGFGMLLGSVYLGFARAIDAVEAAPTPLSWGANIGRFTEAIFSNIWVFLLALGLVFGLQARSHLGAVTRYGLAAAQTVIHIFAIAACDAIARWASNSGGGHSGARWAAVVLLMYALSWSVWGFHRWMFNGRAPRHTLFAPALFGLAVYVFVAEPNVWSWLIPMLGVSSIIGAMVFSATLLISVFTFGDKENLVSVTVRETGWKNFLRVHIDGDTCKVWAVGLQKVPHQRLVFRKDGVENYEPNPLLDAVPAKYTPEVTSIYGGMLGSSQKGYGAKIIDSWTIHRHDIDPPLVADATARQPEVRSATIDATSQASQRLSAQVTS